MARKTCPNRSSVKVGKMRRDTEEGRRGEERRGQERRRDFLRTEICQKLRPKGPKHVPPLTKLQTTKEVLTKRQKLKLGVKLWGRDDKVCVITPNTTRGRQKLHLEEKKGASEREKVCVCVFKGTQ